MTEATYAKAIFITIWGVLTSLFGVLALPLMLMLASNIIDYASGMIAIPYRGDIPKSYMHIHGVMKKVGMWMLVAVGAMIDTLLRYASEQLGMNFPVKYLFACIVCIWIICNELMSILENLRDIGVRVPAFMYEPIGQVQGHLENMTGKSDGSKADDAAPAERATEEGAEP